MSEPTGEIWYLGAPMEVPLSVLKRLGLKPGDSVTSEGWRQIAKAKAGVEGAEALPRRNWRLPVLGIIGAAVIVAAMFAIPAFAQEPPPCGPRDDILGDLKSGYGEQVASRGIDGNGRMVEIVGNPETGTWSEVTTTGDGMSCLTKAGEGFTVFAILPGEPL